MRWFFRRNRWPTWPKFWHLHDNGYPFHPNRTIDSWQTVYAGHRYIVATHLRYFDAYWIRFQQEDELLWQHDYQLPEDLRAQGEHIRLQLPTFLREELPVLRMEQAL